MDYLSPPGRMWELLLKQCLLGTKKNGNLFEELIHIHIGKHFRGWINPGHVQFDIKIQDGNAYFGACLAQGYGVFVQRVKMVTRKRPWECSVYDNLVSGTLKAP